MPNTSLTLLSLIAVMLSLSGCFLTAESTPDSPFGVWEGIRDGFFIFIRLVLKPLCPIDLFADHRTVGYTVGFLLVVIPLAIECNLLVGWLLVRRL